MVSNKITEELRFIFEKEGKVRPQTNVPDTYFEVLGQHPFFDGNKRYALGLIKQKLSSEPAGIGISDLTRAFKSIISDTIEANHLTREEKEIRERILSETLEGAMPSDFVGLAMRLQAYDNDTLKDYDKTLGKDIQGLGE